MGRNLVIFYWSWTHFNSFSHSGSRVLPDFLVVEGSCWYMSIDPKTSVMTVFSPNVSHWFKVWIPPHPPWPVLWVFLTAILSLLSSDLSIHHCLSCGSTAPMLLFQSLEQHRPSYSLGLSGFISTVKGNSFLAGAAPFN